MADVNANIDINIDSSGALAQLKSLQRQIAQFHTSIAKSSSTAALAQRDLQKNLLNSINAIGGLTAEMRTVKTSAESFTDSLEKNKFSMREYFRYAGASTKTFGRLFKSEFDTIGRVAEERVKRLQTQYIKMGRDTNGAMKAMAIMPTQLNLDDYGTQVQLAAQKQALFNQLMKQGSTNLLNFGKNTQWAGRQLMVGFTLPLMAVGSAASKTFMEMEAQSLRFRKVYGDLFTPQEETQQALDNIQALGQSFTKYGVAVSQTVGLAAEAAAAGFQGVDLQRQTAEATRLSVLGQIDAQKALETTISLQNAFGMSSEKLAESIDFLNAVENQTVVSLDDITTAIPKVAPVIQQLGGDVKDLTFFMAAMKEGGINASEGANALKSGLAALINPTKKASEMLASYGINATAIVEKNKGDLKATVIGFAEALNRLDPLARARAIEQMFGKFQFARLSTLFANVAKDGNQASRVLDLANSSVEELSSLSEKELGMTADSAMNKFKKSVEDLKVALVPVGKAFLEAATPIVEFVGNILEKFANLSEGTKRVITLLTVGIGAAGPILLMTFGLLANGLANIIKLFLTLRNGYLRLTGQTQVLGEQTQYMTMEQLDAAAAAHSLNQTHANLTQTFTAEASAVKELVKAYHSAIAASVKFASTNPGMMMPIKGRKKFAKGGVVPGSGNGDTVPAMLTPGEVVIPKGIAKENMLLLSSLMSGNVARRYAEGTLNVGGNAMSLNIHGNTKMSSIQGVVDRLLSQVGKIQSAEEILVETLARVADKTNLSMREFTAQMQHAAENLTGKTIPESIIGQKKYSAPSSLGSLEEQITKERGSLGIEEFTRAKAVSQQHLKSFVEMAGSTNEHATKIIEIMDSVNNQVSKLTQDQIKYIESSGLSTQKVAQLLQIDRAHIQDFSEAEKAYVESWSSRVWVAQPHLENELSNTLKDSLPTRKAYLSFLDQEAISSAEKNEMLRKINSNAALTEKELSIQASILKKMLADQKVMAETSKGFRSAATAIVAGQNVRQGLGAPSAGVGTRDVALALQQRTLVKKAINLGETEFVAKANGKKTIESLLGSMERTAETKSPSRRTRRLAKDIVSGLVVGMKENEAALQAQAQRTADIATLSKTSLYGTTGGIDPVQKSIRRQLDKRARLSEIQQGMAIGPNVMGMMGQQGTQKPSVLGRLRNVNPMKASMGLMGVGMAGSMLPGRAGQVAGQATGAAFIAQALLMLPGPLKLVAGALAAGYGIMKIANFFRQKEIDAIQGVGRAANLTSTQLDKLGEVLGFTPLKSNLEMAKPAVSGLTTEQSKQVEETRKLLATDKDFKGQVKAVSGATNEQADIIFKSLALRLAGQGATKEAIQNYIYALQQEAGRTAVKFDLKSIDLSTKEGRVGLQNSVNTLLKDYQSAFNKGYAKTRVVVGGGKGGVVTKEVEVLSKDLKKSLSTVSNVVANAFMGLDTQLRSGIINADQFSQSFDGISSSIQNMPKANALYLMSELMKSLPSELAQSAAGIKNVSDQLMILKAATLGVSVSAAMLSALAVQSGDGGSERTKGRIRAQLTKQIKERMKMAEEIAKSLGGTETGTGTPGLTNMEKYNKAYAIIKNFFDSQEALIRRQRKSEADLLQSKIDNAQKAVDAAQKEIDAKQELIDANNHEADLLNRKIEMNYDRPIQKLQDESTILNNNLEIIRKQEDGINKQYDAQIDALEKISSLNQELATQEKSRLTIADALTSGDISAAAFAIQEARATAAASRIEQQQNAMEASRTAALTGISAGGMTKDQIEARTYQIGQQTFALEQQKKVLQDQITVIQDKNYAIEQQIYTVKQNSLIPSQKIVDDTSTILKNYNETTDKIVASVKYLGQSADAWEANRIKVEAANTQVEFTKKNLQAAKSAAEGIFAAWNKITSKVITITTNYVTAGAPTNKKMYGGKINAMSMGGVVPKYFASGGRIGSDSVPTMLTPGEFVVNKAASKKFGPLLESLNESKYPSMIGAGSAGYGAPINNVSSSVSDNSTAVYNYSLGFNVNGSNSNANDIAKAVMREIKNVDAQRIRGQRR
jgi:TP901 family phage tail tape measure protein